MVDFGEISSRTDRVISSLLDKPKSKPILSKSEQLRRYTERTSSTAWVDSILDSVPDAHAKDLLKIIKTHGVTGLASYVNAMEKLKKQG